MDEQWKPMVGYEDLYLISDQGRAWSIRRNRIMNGTPSKHRHGYIEFCAVKDGKQKTKQMHQEVYRAFKGSITEGMLVRHKNGNPADNRLENLKIGTQWDNMNDCRAEDYPETHILKESVIATIRTKAKNGLRLKDIAEELGISYITVCKYAESKENKQHRYRLFAHCVKAGCKVELVAEYFDVTHATVVRACKEYIGGVRNTRNQYALNKSLTLKDIPRIIATL